MIAPAATDTRQRLTDAELGDALALYETLPVRTVARRLGFPVTVVIAALRSVGVQL